MQIALLSSPDSIQDEARIVNEMLHSGLSYFHIRKPDFHEKDMRIYLDNIDAQYRPRLIIHQFYHLCKEYGLGGIHINREGFNDLFLWVRVKYLKYRFKADRITTSFHSLHGLRRNFSGYDYVFLTPMFRIKPDGKYEMMYSTKRLRSALRKTSNRIFAMGRIQIDDIDKLKEMNFHGFCFMNAVWRKDNPMDAYNEIVKRCNGALVQ